MKIYRESKMIKRFAVTILVILPFLLTSCAAASNSTVTVTITPTNTVTVTKTVNVTVTATVTPISAPATFTGGGDISTAPFQINSQDWTISWTYTTTTPQYASLSINVYQIGNSLPIATLDDVQPTGSSYSYSGPGQYYFQTNSANIDSWTITAKDAP